MVHKYKRKTNQASWSEDQMRSAMEEARNSTINSASKKYGIPIGTLHRHLKSGDASKKLGRYRPIFSKELEQKIYELAVERDRVFYGLTKDTLQELAYQLAVQNNIPHPFKGERAGKAWLEGFMKRFPELTYRTPEPTALARCSAFNETQVNRFYDNLWTILSKHDFINRPDDIYNMDETGVKTSASKPPKVISVKGKKQVGVISSAEKGQLTTIICACSATGRFIPPCFIFGNRKRMNERLLDGAPNGAQAWCSESGWITNPTYNNWLEIFIEKTRPTKEKPVLLVMDNHATHQNLDGLKLAREKHVIIVSIPPHTSHKLQPLDVAVYRSFKIAFEKAVDTFQKNHPGRRITQFDIAGLVCSAFEKSATVQNATSGFKKSGIFPFNRNLFSELDYAPASVHEQPPIIEGIQNEFVLAATTSAQKSASEETLVENTNMRQITQQNDETDAEDEDISEAANKLPSASRQNDDNMEREAPRQQLSSKIGHGHHSPSLLFSESATIDEHYVEIIAEKEIIDEHTTPKKQGDTETNKETVTPLNIRKLLTLNEPSTSAALVSVNYPILISPNKIMPTPKVTPTIKKRRGKSQKSEILTSTPFKDALEKKMETQKKANKRKKVIPKLRLDKKQKTKKTTKKKENEPPKEDRVFCLFCGEPYENPPTEDWVQCEECGQWAHELCGEIEDRHFYCINCRN